MERLNNIHPGEVLREEFMIPLDISLSELSKATNISKVELFEIIIGIRGINDEYALKLAKYSGSTPKYWLNLQKACNDELNDLAGAI